MAVEALGGVRGCAVGCRVVDTAVCGVGAPTVALVDALSPPLMMTAVATAPSATTAPMMAATGRHRRSAGQTHSSSAPCEESRRYS